MPTIPPIDARLMMQIADTAGTHYNLLVDLSAEYPSTGGCYKASGDVAVGQSIPFQTFEYTWEVYPDPIPSMVTGIVTPPLELGCVVDAVLTRTAPTRWALDFTLGGRPLTQYGCTRFGE